MSLFRFISKIFFPLHGIFCPISVQSSPLSFLSSSCLAADICGKSMLLSCKFVTVSTLHTGVSRELLLFLTTISEEAHLNKECLILTFFRH